MVNLRTNGVNNTNMVDLGHITMEKLISTLNLDVSLTVSSPLK